MHKLYKPSLPPNHRAIFMVNIRIKFFVHVVDTTMMPDNATTLRAPIVTRPPRRPCCIMPSRLVVVDGRCHAAPPRSPREENTKIAVQPPKPSTRSSNRYMSPKMIPTEVTTHTSPSSDLVSVHNDSNKDFDT
jgi:hypothetical protein